MNSMRVIFTDVAHRDMAIGQQIGENYRLKSEKKLEGDKIALLFKPIVFKKLHEPPQEMKARFWQVKNKIEGMKK